MKSWLYLPKRLSSDSDLDFSKKVVAAWAYFVGAALVGILGLVESSYGFSTAATIEALFAGTFFSLWFVLFTTGHGLKPSIWIMAIFVSILPPVITMTMGGFVESGGRSIWAFMAPVGALILWNDRKVYFTFVGFATLFGASIIFHFSVTEQLPSVVSTRLLLINLTGTCTFAFLCFYSFFKQIQGIHQAQKQVAIAEATAHTKSQFLSIMSHEIRTPLNSIIGMSEILLEENSDKQQIENLNILNFSSQNLLSLVNDILDYSKMEAGKVKLDSTPFGLNDFIQSTYFAFVPIARENNVDFNVSYQGDTGIFIEGDPARLGQIINNLISNAIKFSPLKSVDFMVRLYSNEILEIIVKDTGVGIPSHHLPNLFHQFSQADASISRKFGGTGLGLAITYGLVKLLKGSIDVVSQEGEGTQMTVNIPITTTQPPTFQEQPSDLNVFAKILVVDDNKLNLKVASKILSVNGHQVVTTTSGIEALAMVQQENYDLVLLDLQMPIMDGFQTSKEMRHVLPDKQIPILALSAESKEDVIEKVLDSGMQGFIQKPFNKKRLLSQISVYANLRN